jgi:hypothetical protein
MREFLSQVHSARSTQKNAESRFGLFDLAKFVLGHITVPAVRHTPESKRRAQTETKWTRQLDSNRMIVHRVFCRIQSRFQTMWSLPPGRTLQFSREDVGYQAND